MAANIVYKRSVLKDLKRLSRAGAGQLLDRVEGELSERAHTCPVLKGQFAGLRKLRVGDYRVIFAIMEKDIIVLRIGHRKEVYKKKIGTK